MTFLECTKKCLKILFLKFIEKILIVVILWVIFSKFFSSLFQYFINDFGLKMIYGFSINSIFSMILSGYICFLLYPKIASFGYISDVATKLNNLYKKCSDTKTKPEEETKPEDRRKYRYESAKFAYEKLLQIRDLDNELMWTRINILIVFQGVLIGAIAAGFDILKSNQPKLLVLITGIGFFSSIILYSIAKGGSWWITHWEKALSEVEPSVIGEIEIFSGHHHAADPKFKSEKKTEGYVSTRDWILVFTIALSLLWIIIFTYSLSFLSTVDVYDKFTLLQSLISSALGR